MLLVVVKFEAFRIKFKKIESSSRKNKVRKSQKADLMSVSQSSSSSIDQLLLASLHEADFFNKT